MSATELDKVVLTGKYRGFKAKATFKRATKRARFQSTWTITAVVGKTCTTGRFDGKACWSVACQYFARLVEARPPKPAKDTGQLKPSLGRGVPDGATIPFKRDEYLDGIMKSR